MKNPLHKLAQFGVLILGLTTLSHTMDQDSFEDYSKISLNIKSSIESQQTSLKATIKSKQKEISPEEIQYDTQKELHSSENIYHFSDEKSPCGFLCGRCRFLFYDGQHPNHDCCRCYWPKHMPWEEPYDDSCCSCLIKGLWVLNYNVFPNGIFGFIPSFFLTNSFINPTVLGFLPLIITSSLTCCLTTHWLLPNACYKCAEYRGDQDFMDSFKSGQLCLPEDACSCTSCFYVNFYKDHKKYCCCCCG